MSDQKPKPSKRIKDGNIAVSIWENERETTDGEPFTAVGLVLQRSYLDRYQEWQQRNIHLDVNEVPRILLALQKAYEEVAITVDVID